MMDCLVPVPKMACHRHRQSPHRQPPPARRFESARPRNERPALTWTIRRHRIETRPMRKEPASHRRVARRFDHIPVADFAKGAQVVRTFGIGRQLSSERAGSSGFCVDVRASVDLVAALRPFDPGGACISLRSVRPAAAGRTPCAGGSNRPRMAPAPCLSCRQPECRGACASRLRLSAALPGRADGDELQ